jgi:cobalt-precorrin 5A hydrolase / precorrin-3B C17-methyltransferase
LILMRTIIFILGPSALPLARRLRGLLFAEIHAPHGTDGVNYNYAKATSHLAEMFLAGHSIIGICAAGILIRAIGPHTKAKSTEPPVIALSENGDFAIPLLGGHHGANELARKIAELTSGHAAVTTASDVVLGVSLDEPPPGYVVANLEHVKSFTVRLLAGEKVCMKLGDAPWLSSITSATGTVPVGVTSKSASTDVFIYHPRTLCVGIGCERGTDPVEVQQLVDDTFAEHGLAKASIACFASIDLKQDETAITALGDVRYFSTKALNAESSRVQRPSEIVRAEVGTPSVAEAAALAAAGPDAKLIVPKQKSARATIAIAEAPHPILDMRGQPRGILQIVGIGPGTPLLRSPAVTQCLSRATDWVGYGLYLELAKDQHTDQILHDFPLGGEEDRCRHAINLAKQGKRVALVCSGDAAIYAMASLVYELIDREPCRIAIEVQPGISAFQLASAKLGALIGHDFCCISLSDLLTPWETIVQRVAAAAQGDFVIAFYNPRSLKRTDQISKAFDILKPHRRPDTPVILASNLGRPEETVRVLNFNEFNPESVDMLTIVMVGSTQSKTFRRGDGQTSAYTPRGYAKKMDQQ